MYPIFWEFGGKIEFLAPIISSVGNLQLSIGKLQLRVSSPGSSSFFLPHVELYSADTAATTPLVSAGKFCVVCSGRKGRWKCGKDAGRCRRDKAFHRNDVVGVW